MTTLQLTVCFGCLNDAVVNTTDDTVTSMVPTSGVVTVDTDGVTWQCPTCGRRNPI